MSGVNTVLVLCLAIMSTAHAEGQAPSAGKSDPYVRDRQTVDFFVPVVSVEQFYFLHAPLQGYRLQIFKDGRGIYHGLKNVKTLGEIRFNLKPEQVQDILAKFERYKYWQVPEDQYGLPRGFGVMTLQFVARNDERVKSVRFGGQRQGVALLSVIESHVQSERWRCPYVDENEADVCIRRRRDIEEDAPLFLMHDLPKLEETYK